MANSSHLTDDQLDHAYQKALKEYQPSELVEQRIKTLARDSIPKVSHWAAFPTWARVASIAGVTVLGWWMMSSQVVPPETSDTAEEVEVMEVQEMYAAPESIIADSAPSQRLLQPVKPQVEKEVRARMAMPSSKQRSAKASFRDCMSLKLAQESEFKILPGLPEGLTAEQLGWADLVQWQGQPWRIAKQDQLWYLARQEGESWQHLLLPETLVAPCDTKQVSP